MSRSAAPTGVLIQVEDDLDQGDGGQEQTLLRRRWPLRLVLVLLVVTLVGAGYVVGFSPVLALREVAIAGSGAPALTEQVRSAVGVAGGTPMALIDLGEVHDRVAAVGPVASVSVHRQWPHTLVVTVTARTPVAVTQANGHWWLLDATGKPYQTVSSPPAGLMTLKLVTPGEGDRATAAALGVLGSLPTALRALVSSISAPSAWEITLNLTDGRTVLWGADSDNAVKATVLPVMLARPGKVFDISDPTLVTVR